jgi:membrane protein YdbS with pleckstrin-like domain
MHQHQPPQLHSTFQPYDIKRPAPVLMWYYFLVSLLMGPLFVVALLPLYFKYITLRYHFDDKGISMSWGILWRREVLLTYRRIQDIHLTRNIVQRWLGLASVSVQTASGSASAEMTLEGILEAEPLRDFLYAQMRGARGLATPGEAAAAAGTVPVETGDEALTLLRDIRDALARLAAAREARP